MPDEPDVPELPDDPLAPLNKHTLNTPARVDDGRVDIGVTAKVLYVPLSVILVIKNSTTSNVVSTYNLEELATKVFNSTLTSFPSKSVSDRRISVTPVPIPGYACPDVGVVYVLLKSQRGHSSGDLPLVPDVPEPPDVPLDTGT